MNFSEVKLSDRQKDLARKMDKLLCSIHVLQNTVFTTTHVTSWTFYRKDETSVTRFKYEGFVDSITSSRSMLRYRLELCNYRLFVYQLLIYYSLTNWNINWVTDVFVIKHTNKNKGFGTFIIAVLYLCSLYRHIIITFRTYKLQDRLINNDVLDQVMFKP